MGFLDFFADIGSIGSTTKWAINGYLKLKSQNKNLSDQQIFSAIIEIRFIALPNDEQKNYLLSQVKDFPGLAGLVIEILNIEADLYKNDGNLIVDIIKPIFRRLEETELPKKTKYGIFKAPPEEKNFFLLSSEWTSYIYDFYMRRNSY